jgi:glutaredoxin
LGKTFNIKGDVTVPQIVIDGRHVGGYTDMMELYEKDELKFNDL